MIAKVLDHWVDMSRPEQIKGLFGTNTGHIKKMKGLVARYTLQSKSDPNKWTTITIWENEEAADAWQTNPDHIWDVYGQSPNIPSGTEYHRKYANAPGVQTKPSVGETFEVITDA